MMSLEILNNSVVTMTSREIAELAGKRHDNVMADIRKMLDELDQTSPEKSGDVRPSSAEFSANLPDSYGRMQPGFRLPKRETLILVSGYSVTMRARIIDRWDELEQGGKTRPVPATLPVSLMPVDLLEQTRAMKTILADDDLKLLAPLLWQEIADGVQNAMRRALGSVPALPAPDASRLLDVVEIAKAEGIDLPSNLKGSAGKYVKARVQSVETERLINGSIRKSFAYTDHDAVTKALREYLASK